MTPDVDNLSHCECDNDQEDCDIEITEEMIRVGEDLLIEAIGGVDLGAFFSAADLAERVFRATWDSRPISQATRQR